MFSFLTTFSGYLSKAFGRPTPEMHTLGMDNILLQMLNFEHHLETQNRVNVFIIGEKDSPKIQQAIEIVKKAGLEVDTSAPNVVNAYGKGYSFPQLFVVEIEKHSLSNFDELMEHLTTFAGRKEIISLPAVFVKGNYYGGVKDLESHLKHGVLNEALKDHDYDLVVIGGGSGGLAAGKAAVNADSDDVEKLRKIAVFDYVKPTPIGTTWGLGGTCVNVGCIPKKLMHQAALLGKSLYDARMFGWEFDEKCSINWSTLVANVHNHILGLNWGYKSKLREEKITYYNAYASFVGSHKVKAVDKTGKEIIVTSDRFIIATGLRPRYLDIPGAKEFCITSDDLFTLPYPPGKTLIVGASYVALECAGFLHGFGFDVTVMVRSIFLRGFDQDMAERIGKHMEEMGVKFIKQTIPTSIEKLEDGKPGMYKVTAKSDSGEIVVGEYNTIMIAIGRDAITDDVGLEEVGILRNPKNKKVICHENEQSVTMPHVYAVGDVLDGKLELTPVAIQAGRFLADRLFRPSFLLCDYANVPTTIFTPLEYGCCGLSEEAAKEKYENSLMVYHSAFTPLEYTISKRKDSGHCYAKLICVDTDGSDNKLVVGLHILGPNAGEITQGFAMALKTGATVNDFKKLVGIHPTCAEVLTFASLVEKSEDPAASGGC